MKDNDSLLNLVLDSEISLFSSVSDKTSNTLTIRDILSLFRSDKFSIIIENARKALNENNKERYNTIKSTLPVVTFSGIFIEGHKKSNLVKYSNVIVLDIDNLCFDELEKQKSNLKNDDYVFAYWESPSKRGIKALIYLIFDDNEDLDLLHKNAFNELKSYFEEKYNMILDSSGSDFSRLCFVCWDKDLVIKNKIKPFCSKLSKEQDILNKEKSSKITKNVQISSIKIQNIKGKNESKKRNELERIIRFLNKRKLSITYSYNDWLAVAFAIVSAFNIDLGRKYFIQLSKMDPEKFNEIECNNLLNNCYKTYNGSINFGTIIYKAQQLGYKRKGMRTEDTD